MPIIEPIVIPDGEPIVMYEPVVEPVSFVETILQKNKKKTKK